jgi:ribosomal protein L10
MGRAINRNPHVSTLVVKSKIGQLALAQTLTTEFGIPPSSSRRLNRAAREAEHVIGANVLGYDTKTLPSVISNTNFVELLQGPTFLFACNSHHEMVVGCKVIGNKRDRYSNNHAALLGGIYYGKVVTHRDIAKLSILNSSIYASIPITLGSKMVSFLVDGVSHSQHELLRCLEQHKNNLLLGKHE